MIWWIILATFIVSLISLVGIIISSNKIQKFLYYFIAFSAGTLIAATFFDLIPHALIEIEEFGVDIETGFIFVVFGIVLFFILEKFIHWHHCGKEKCHKPTGLLILTGDFVHNFIDGVLIAGAFMLDFTTGIVTSFIVLIHEIPQEFGDFAVLMHSGYTKSRALFLNFVSALSAILGGILGFFMFDMIESFSPYAVLIAAGGFLYIAMSDIIPSMNGHEDKKRLILGALIFILTIILMRFFLEMLHGI